MPLMGDEISRKGALRFDVGPDATRSVRVYASAPRASRWAAKACAACASPSWASAPWAAPWPRTCTARAPAASRASWLPWHACLSGCCAWHA